LISEYLKSVVRCPLCRSAGDGGNGGAPPLDADGDAMRCPRCGREFKALAENGYLDLRPPAGTFDDLTEYAEEEFHHRAGAIRPLFLSAKIKMDMMSKMLAPSPGDRMLDIGCGKGQFLFYNRASCGQLVGIDAGAHFAPEPLATVDLTRGDIRMLPFEDGSFDKAYSLDVLEHLDEDGVHAMLAEARRVLKPGGKLFLYSHVMMSSKLAVFQRSVNRLVHWLDARGLVDNEPERERKSDHRNALESYEQLDQVLVRAGFEIAEIRYYNVFFKALFEDLMLPLVEHNFFAKKKTPASDNGDHDHGHHDHHHESTKPDVGRWAHAPLTLATYMMKLDVALFGRIRTGPFFLLLEAV
jgi:ubiquinone/menaquinone biosynthesis C-methylase UbiE